MIASGRINCISKRRDQNFTVTGTTNSLPIILLDTWRIVDDCFIHFFLLVCGISYFQKLAVILMVIPLVSESSLFELRMMLMRLEDMTTRVQLTITNLQTTLIIIVVSLEH